MFVGAGFAMAATAPADRLAALAQEVARLTAERDRLSSREEGILDRLDRLAAEARLADAHLESLRLRRQQAQAELERAAARQREEELSLDRARALFRQTVLLLQRIGPLARLRPLLDAPDAGRLAAALRLGHELTSRHQQQVEAIHTHLEELRRVRERRERKSAEVEELRVQAADTRNSLRRAISARRGLLESIGREKEQRTKAITELERAREMLSAVIAGLRPPEDVALDIRPFRGLLDPPAEGRVSQGYGDRRDPRFGTVIPHPGWDIEASFGAAVRSPFEGRVAFADWFRGYGLLVVLDHGAGVHTIYAHLSAVLVQTGEAVDRGSLIGRVGDTGSLRGPFLYLEVRENGRSVDPAGWFRR